MTKEIINTSHDSMCMVYIVHIEPCESSESSMVNKKSKEVMCMRA